MPRRISDEDRIEQYFKSATEIEARGSLRVAEALVNLRFPDSQKKTKPRRGKPQPVVKAIDNGGDLEKR